MLNVLLATVLFFSRLDQGDAASVRSMPRAYCGVMALQAGAQCLGHPIDPAGLAKPEFISEQAGSSVADLLRAARGAGIRADAFEHLNVEGLRFLSGPALLLVRRDAASRTTNHWILYVGESGGVASIVDPVTGAERPLLNDLASRWGGAGIALGGAPHPLIAPERLASYAQTLSIGALLLAAIYFGHAVAQALALKSGMVSRRGITIEIGVLVSLCCGVTVFGQWCSPTSLFHQSAAGDLVRQEMIATFLPRVRREGLMAVSHRPDSHLVDARISEDAQQGMIPGAVNLYADIAPAELKVATIQWRREGTVVIYCRNEGCPFSARLAAKFQELGFTDIRLYRGGWDEWSRSGMTPAVPGRPASTGGRQ